MNEHLLKLWVLCMSKANWQENEIRLEGVADPVKLEPGQFITGRSMLHGEYHRWKPGHEKRHPSPYTLWRWLKALEKRGFLHIKSCNKFSVITLSTWAMEAAVDSHSTMHNKTPKSAHPEPTEIPADQSHMSSNVSSKTRKSEQQREHREEVFKNKEGEVSPQKKKTSKDKDDIRPCDECGKPFVPAKFYHDLCDRCFRPGVTRKTGARPELLNKECQGCGLHASNVVNGFCPFCQWEQEEAIT